MEFEKFKHKGVNKKGIVKSGGAVHTEGKVILIKGNCGLEGCHCSDGYSLTICMPLKKGIVEGIEVKFDSYEEMKNILKC